MSNVDDVLQQVVSGQSSPYAEIDRWVKDERFQDVEEFVQKLVQLWDDNPQELWRYSGNYNHVLEGLALTAGTQYIEQLLSVLKYRPQNDKLLHRVAAQLASTQDPEILDRFAVLPIASSLWDHLVHELVIEGLPISLLENLSHTAQTMIEQKHPLSALPLSLMPVESEIKNYRRYYSVGGAGAVTPSVQSDQEGQFGVVDPASGIVCEETTTPELQARLQSAFENWTQESNGKLEARQFTAQEALSEEVITRTRLLLDLKLECLEGVREETIWIVSSQNVLNALFAAASNGGAYNSGVGNAYGRLATWTSLGALMNEPEATPIPELNDRLDETLWFALGISSSWFYDVAWDVAIVTLSRDRRVVTVLAATDTD